VSLAAAALQSQEPIRLETDSIRISSMDTAGISSIPGRASTTMVQGEELTSYAEWCAASFSAAELADPAVSAWDADPDGVGISNLCRYAFDLAARGAVSRSVLLGVQGMETGGNCQLEFQRKGDAPTLSYHVEASDDLASWSLVETVLPGYPNEVAVADNDAPETGGRRFLRVRVVDTEAGTGREPCVAVDPEETFSNEDAPKPLRIEVSRVYFSSPWGYEKAANADRLYPVVVNGYWGEGSYFTREIRQKYPAFFLEFQRDAVSDGEWLAEIIDNALAQGVRVDPNRIYLTGFSRGGSGSYQLIRGFLNGGRRFAGLIRVAGQSQTTVPDEVVGKTAIWYHLGLEDTPTRVQVARDAYAFLKGHEHCANAIESTVSDLVTGYDRTTRTLTQDGGEIVKYSEYTALGHAPGPVYADPEVFAWLFRQTLECR